MCNNIDMNLLTELGLKYNDRTQSWNGISAIPFHDSIYIYVYKVIEIDNCWDISIQEIRSITRFYHYYNPLHKQSKWSYFYQKKKSIILNKYDATPDNFYKFCSDSNIYFDSTCAMIQPVESYYLNIDYIPINIIN